MLKSIPTSETLSSEQDRSLEISEKCSRGIRLMIIELRRYNKIGELLVANGTTGSQAQVSYWDMVRETSVTRVAVCMGLRRWGCKQGAGAQTIGLQVGIENRNVHRHRGAIKKH